LCFAVTASIETKEKSNIKLICYSRFQRAFTSCSCVYKEITLVSWFAATNVISLKTQPHAVNACVKCLLQRSLTKIKNRSLLTIFYCYVCSQVKKFCVKFGSYVYIRIIHGTHFRVQCIEHPQILSKTKLNSTYTWKYTVDCVGY